MDKLDAEWPKILDEAKFLSVSMGVHPVPHISQSFATLTDDETIANVFDNILKSVHQGIEKRFKALRKIVDMFSFLWSYPKITEDSLEDESSFFCDFYNDVSKPELIDELRSL